MISSSDRDGAAGATAQRGGHAAKARRSVALALLAIMLAAPAAAQQAEVAGEPATRARQAALFDQLLQRPDDLDLMLEYARVSVALEDYEAAISTLERILIYAPNLTPVQVELGAAYFRLGSDSVANYYFQRALSSPDVTPAQRQQIARFQDVIAERQSPSRFSGQAMVGVTATSNANLGPTENSVLVRGLPVVLPGSLTPDADVGLRVVVDVQHEYDLGQADADVWRTNLFGYALQFLDEDEGNVNDVVIRTGPTFTIGEASFGPRIRPFAEAEIARVDDQTLFRGLGGGVEASVPISGEWSAVGAISVQERQFFDNRSDLDGIYGRALAGPVWLPSDNLVLRGFAIGEVVEADRSFNDYYMFGVRGSAAYLYDPGFDWAPRDWRAEGFFEISRRIYESPNAVVDPNRSRRETEFRIGVSNTFFLTDNLFLRADADFADRNSNLANFDFDSISGTFSVGSTF